jgi:hypothetical protein
MSLTTLVVGLVTFGLLLIFAWLVHAQLGLKQAERRAEALVREFLTADDLSMLHYEGYLTVPSGGTPGRVYRIPARPGAVIVVDDGAPVVQLCLVPVRAIPEPERILAHKLLLEGAEADYWQRANHLRLPGWLYHETRAELWTSHPPGVMRSR